MSRPSPFERLEISLTVDDDVARFEDAPSSYGSGVYRVDNTSIIVLNQLWPCTRIELANNTRPASIGGLVAMAVLPGDDRLARIVIDKFEPPTLAPHTAVLAALHAAYDDELEPEASVDCAVRLLDRELRARLVYDNSSNTWSSTIEEAGEPERHALKGCALYRSIQIRDGWGAWRTDGFRIEDSPRARDKSVWFTAFSIGGKEIAVITEPLAPSVATQILATSRPPFIEGVVLVAHKSLSPEVSVISSEPSQLDDSIIATAAACGAASSGFGADPSEYRVRLANAVVIEVLLDFDDEDRSWSARCAPRATHLPTLDRSQGEPHDERT